MSAISVLEELRAHPILHALTLDGVMTFTRLASHLNATFFSLNKFKRVILVARQLRFLQILQAFLVLFLEPPWLLSKTVGAFYDTTLGQCYQ